MRRRIDLEYKEREAYFNERGWNWTSPTPVKVVKPVVKRKLFLDDSFQMLRPKISIFTEMSYETE